MSEQWNGQYLAIRKGHKNDLWPLRGSALATDLRIDGALDIRPMRHQQNGYSPLTQK
jgi:hypothetical protein